MNAVRLDEREFRYHDRNHVTERTKTREVVSLKGTVTLQVKLRSSTRRKNRTSVFSLVPSTRRNVSFLFLSFSRLFFLSGS